MIWDYLFAIPRTLFFLLFLLLVPYRYRCKYMEWRRKRYQAKRSVW